MVTAVTKDCKLQKHVMAVGKLITQFPQKFVFQRLLLQIRHLPLVTTLKTVELSFPVRPLHVHESE